MRIYDLTPADLRSLGYELDDDADSDGGYATPPRSASPVVPLAAPVYGEAIRAQFAIWPFLNEQQVAAREELFQMIQRMLARTRNLEKRSYLMRVYTSLQSFQTFPDFYNWIQGQTQPGNSALYQRSWRSVITPHLQAYQPMVIRNFTRWCERYHYLRHIVIQPPL